MILDGKKIAENIHEELQTKIHKLDTPPSLWAVLVGDNSVSMRYITQKKRFAEKVGINFTLFTYPEDISEENLLYNISGINKNSQISGYIIQLPLPKHIDTLKILNAIDPNKDVDGFHPQNQGKVMIWDDSGFTPCTPAGIMKILEHYQIELAWKRVVILWKSNIVGKPLINLCMNAGATVVWCNSQTPDISLYTKHADVIISAVGKPGIIHPEIVSPHSVIIDVGFCVTDGKIRGDCLYHELVSQGNTITPVPGWVGPMTVAMLLKNTYQAHTLSLWTTKS